MASLRKRRIYGQALIELRAKIMHNAFVNHAYDADYGRLQFCLRVITEGRNPALGYGERLRFFGIGAAAPDEFDTVRAAVIFNADPRYTVTQAAPQAVQDRITKLYRSVRRRLYAPGMPVIAPAVSVGAVNAAVADEFMSGEVGFCDRSGQLYKLLGPRFVICNGVLSDRLTAPDALGVPFYLLRNAGITGYDSGSAADITAMLACRRQSRVMRLESTRHCRALQRLFNPFLYARVPVPGAAHYREAAAHYKSLPVLTPRTTSVITYERIRAEDILLHHPYDPYRAVVDFCNEAADDDAVEAISQTLYRTSAPSPFVDALCRAASNGKEVTALIELRARFDEAANVRHAQVLQHSGVRVLTGCPGYLSGYKVHGKTTVIRRREGRERRLYAHIGTGNYHPGTAGSYVDFSLFTADPQLTAAASGIFGADVLRQSNDLLTAPGSLKSYLLRMIAAEKTAIAAKMNGLTDPDVAKSLQKAARRGVDVRLSVRGACILLPETNLRIRSLLGRLLEHARFFIFTDGDEVRLSSADWMTRNLERRVEMTVPVRSKALQQRLKQCFEIEFDDTEHAYGRQRNGHYKKAAAVKRVDAYDQMLRSEQR